MTEFKITCPDCGAEVIEFAKILASFGQLIRIPWQCPECGVRYVTDYKKRKKGWTMVSQHPVEVK